MSGVAREENIRLRITAASELPDVASQLEELIKLTKQQQELTQQAALSARTGSIQQVDAIQSVTAALKEQQTQQKKTGDESGDALKKINGQFDDLGKQVRTFTGLLATAFTFEQLKSFGADIIETKTKIDSLKISLDVMLGSKKESAALYSQMVELAKQTPFSLEEVAENVVKLKAYNVATSDLIPTLTALGNVAAAVGKDKLPQITLAYGQVMNMGKLMGTETRQFIESGIDLYGMLQVSMGKTKDEVVKLAAEHKIMASDVKAAFEMASAEGGRFYNLMALQTKTVGGEVDKLKDSYQQAKVMIGNFYEDTIKSGTSRLSELLEATLGSNTAIARTVDIVKSVVAGIATLLVVTKGQEVATKALAVAEGVKNGVMMAGELIAGTYNLVMIAATGTTEGFTAAQLRSAVAARSTWAAFAANPLGPILITIGLLTTAYYAFKAASDEVTTTLGEQELKLKDEQASLNNLAKAALNAGENTKVRKDAIEQLIKKYPEYFSGLDKEKTSNDQLRGILDAVNKSYTKRIDLAREAYKADELSKDRLALFQKEQDFFDSIGNKQVFDLAGGSVQKFLDILKAGGKTAEDLRDKLDDAATNGAAKFEIAARRINNEFVKVERASSESNTRKQAADDAARAAEVKAIEAHYDTLVAQANGNAKKIAQLNAEEKIAIAKANGTYREAEVKAVVDHAEKTKQVTLVSAKEIALITGEGEAEKEIDREKSLKAQLASLKQQEDAEIESVKKITVNRKISAAALAELQENARKQIAAIDAKYDLQRAGIMEQLEAETQRKFLEKMQETNDKVAVLVAKRLEAEKMLTLLNDAKTNDQRLAALKVYHDQYAEDVQAATVKELKLQLDASTMALDDVIQTNGQKGDEYRRAYAAWEKDNLAYNTAVTKQTVDAAKETAKSLEDYEKQIQAARKETAKLDKDNLEQTKKNHKELITSLAQLVSQGDSFTSQLATGLISVYNSIDGLQFKALASSKSLLSSAQDTLFHVQGMYDGSTAEGAAAIETAKSDVAFAQGEVVKAKGASAQMVFAVMGAVQQVLSTIAGAYNEHMRAINQAVADGMAKVRNAYKTLYDYVQQAGEDSYQEDLKNFSGSLQQKEEFITEYYAKEKEFAQGQDRIDDQLAYYQHLAQIQANGVDDSKAFAKEMADYGEAQLQRQAQAAINQANREKQEAADLRDAKIAALDAAFDAFKETKEKEIDAAKEATDQQKDLIEQERDAKIDALNAQLDAAKTSYDKQVQAARDAYDTQLTALKDKESQERSEIQATYDLKQSLLEQGTNDEIEKIKILEPIRNDVLERYRKDETDKLIATRDRILATLTDEGQRMQVTNDFARQIQEVNDQVEDAKVDKAKGTTLATTQLRNEEKTNSVNLKNEEKTELEKLDDSYQVKFKALADERDTTLAKLKDDQVIRETELKNQINQIKEESKTAISKIENDLKNEINQLKDQITQKEDETAQAKKRINYEYKQAVLAANGQIFESNRTLLIAQLQAQIAVLNSQKSWTGIGNGKINDAIATIEQSIRDIGGIVFNTQGDIKEYFDIIGLDSTGNAKQPMKVQFPANVVLSEPAYTQSGDPITLAYKDTEEKNMVYDKNGDPFFVTHATGKNSKTGEQLFFQGTEFVQGLGLPDGIDTVPARLTKGERVLPTADNLSIGGRELTNEELVKKVKGYDQLMLDFPKMFMPAQTDLQLRIPGEIMNAQGGSQVDMSGVIKELGSLKKSVTTAIKNQKLLNVHIDRNGTQIYERSLNQKISYYDTLFNR